MLTIIHKPINKEARMRVLNLGAGVQSTVVYLMAVRGELEIDHAIFADTGEEPSSVYRHLEWLMSLDGPPIHIVRKGILGDDLIKGINSTGQKFVPIPAFTHSGRIGQRRGQIRRQCTHEYKIRPIERYIRTKILGLKQGQRVPKGVVVTQLYGISLDEARRARSIQERLKETYWLRPEFPLLERFMTRADCLNWLAKFGVPHEVPRSSCVFCPYKSDAEWVALKTTDPNGWERAIKIDEALRQDKIVLNRNMDQKIYLHPSCKPLKEVEFKPLTERDKQLSISFAIECAGMCGV